jgi:hypothetical protein
MNNTLTIKLKDLDQDQIHRLHIDFDFAEEPGVGIRIDGYSDMCTYDEGCPILITFREGIPYVHIWADINQEDPTHIISLAGASETNRIE